MELKYILFVEDDASQRDLFSDSIRAWNEANGHRKFSEEMHGDLQSAQEALRFKRFDCALFDLRLPETATGGRSGAEHGNKLAEAGLRTVGIPVGVISGNPADIAFTLSDTHLVRAFNKDGGTSYDEALNWFGSLWDMMTVLAGARAHIQKSGADIFSKRVWPRWSEFSSLNSGSVGEITPIVTRQYASHIAELLGTDGPENPGWHPFESFINPALQNDRAHTGDIFNFDGEYWIVLSPPCDMATKKIKNVILALCTDIGLEKWNENAASMAEAFSDGRQPSGKITKYFLDLVNQNGELSKHFLPPIQVGKPLFVNFKEVITKPLEEINGGLNQRIASVAPSFLPNLIQRFGAYISRTGQPNIDIKHFGSS